MKDYAQVKQMQTQVKAAWAKLPPDLKARLEPQILAAHQYALAVRNRAVPPTTPPVRHQLLMMYSLLNDDPDGLLKSATAPAAEGLSPWVGGDGEVFFGGVTYDSTDPGWGYLLVALAWTWGQTPAFKLPPNYPAQPAITIPDNVTLGILGDWGGWNAPAQQVGSAAKAADFLIHLGDVYYAGTNASDVLEPYESIHFLNVWPGPVGQSFDLNSNHDMYAHATGYSLTTLAPGTAFKAQQGANVFALSNSAFRIVGLDSAYYSSVDTLYDVGTLGSPTGGQAMFLQQQAKLAAAAGQELIILTHHNGLSADGSTPTALWQEVANQLSALSGKSVCWYWGHVHVGAVYKPQTVNGVTIYSRCCGHGCIPWGVAKSLEKSSVLWFEQELLGPGPNYFVTNGYSTLELDGTSMIETFFDQSGKSQWSDTWPNNAAAERRERKVG
jgi:hypothetical protein